MKKILILCLFSVVLLFSCGRESTTPLVMVQSVLARHTELPFGDVIYHSDAILGDKEYMSPRLQSLLYDEGRGRQLPEFETVRAYAVALSQGQYGAEMHVFQMASQADARCMEALLQRRLAQLKRRSIYLYAPSAYEDFFVSATVVVEDTYVFLLSTGKNEVILQELKKMI